MAGGGTNPPLRDELSGRLPVSSLRTSVLQKKRNEKKLWEWLDNFSFTTPALPWIPFSVPSLSVLVRFFFVRTFFSVGALLCKLAIWVGFSNSIVLV